MKKKKKKYTKTICRGIIVFFAITAVIVGFTFLSTSLENNRQIPSSSEISKVTDYSNAIYNNGEYYEKKNGIETWLLMGIDRTLDVLNQPNAMSSSQTDFMTLVIIDNNNQSYDMVQINRDTMTDIDRISIDGELLGTTVNAQLTLAFTYGIDPYMGSENTVRAVTNLFYEQEIDNYLSFTMDLVPKITDLLGGIELEILHDFTSVDPSMVQGETVLLSGDQALKYVQHRVDVGDNTNIERMQRQDQFIKAFEEKATAEIATNPQFVVDLISSASEYIFTDSSIQQLNNLIDSVSEYTFGETHTILGEAKVAEEYMEYYVDEQTLRELVIELFYNKID